jgi:predicted dithiol-disulfide oxidoreductase (DUF899 family)
MTTPNPHDEVARARADYQAAEEELLALRQRMLAIKRRLVAADPVPLPDYRFQTADGTVGLAELFGDKQDLLVIHNMGRGCSYCTLWADGFQGLLPHLEDRAAVVLSSPDLPEVQRDFAASRGWGYRMVSVADSPFAQDLGFKEEDGYWPGVSAFRRQPDGSIVRVAADYFGPGDVYCGAWHLYDLLADGADGWQPRFAYGG